MKEIQRKSQSNREIVRFSGGDSKFFWVYTFAVQGGEVCGVYGVWLCWVMWLNILGLIPVARDLYRKVGYHPLACRSMHPVEQMPRPAVPTPPRDLPLPRASPPPHQRPPRKDLPHCRRRLRRWLLRPPAGADPAPFSDAPCAPPSNYKCRTWSCSLRLGIDFVWFGLRIRISDFREHGRR